MQISDWVLVGTTLFLGGMALLAPYIIEKWKYMFYSAKLNFKFYHKPPYCHITEMRGSLSRFPVYYFRFKIINEGKIQAEQCEAVLENIWRKNSAGKFIKYESFSPVSLKWSGSGNNKYLTIQPGREIFCDIGRIHHPDNEPESVYRGITDKEKKKISFSLNYRRDFFHNGIV